MSQILIFHDPFLKTADTVALRDLIYSCGHRPTLLADVTVKNVRLANFLDEEEGFVCDQILSLDHQRIHQVSLSQFLISAIDIHDFVVVVESGWMFENFSYLLVLGYLVGKSKIIYSHPTSDAPRPPLFGLYIKKLPKSLKTCLTRLPGP